MLEITRGRTAEMEITVVNPTTSEPIDLTGKMIDFYLKHSSIDNNADAIMHKATGIGILVENALEGRVLVTLTIPETAGLDAPDFLHCTIVVTTSTGKIFTALSEALKVSLY